MLLKIFVISIILLGLAFAGFAIRIISSKTGELRKAVPVLIRQRGSAMTAPAETPMEGKHVRTVGSQRLAVSSLKLETSWQLDSWTVGQSMTNTQ